MSLVKRPARSLALMSMLFFVNAGTALAEDYPAPVDVDEVVLSKADETIDVLGRVVALQAGPVAARTAAAAETVHVNVGDLVSKGDVLVTLHNNRQRSLLALTQAEVKQWQARLKSAQFEKALAERDLQRLEKLRGSSAFNESLFDQRSTAVQSAAAQATEAEASLAYARIQVRRAQQDYDWTKVQAPYDAVVAERHVDEGQWVALGAPVMNLVSTAALEVEVDIPAQYVGGVQQGDAINATVNGQNLELTLRALLPAEKALSRTRLARLSIGLMPGQRPPLTVNQAVNVSVPVSQQEAVTVHKDAVIRNGSMTMVYKVVEGAAQMAPVQLGAASGDRMQVLDGLVAGDVVVTRGNERLHPGQKVMPRQ